MIKWSKNTAKRLIRKVTHAEGTPEEIGTAVGFGIFVAFFPIFGTHTALCFGIGWLCRLNPAVILAGSFVNNPFTIVPIFLSGFYVGLLITGTAIPESFSWGIDINTLMELGKVFIIPFIIGNIVLGILAGVIGYFLAVRAVVRYRTHKAARSVEADGNSKREGELGG